jgi:heme oxygenase
MILKRLRLATNARHTALENQLPLMNADLSLEDYRQFVERFFGFYAPLEAQMMASPHWPLLEFEYTTRQKTPRLAQDLLALGSNAAAVAATPRCIALPACTTPEQLLGCLYVIEGATLGGRSITRHLQTRFGLTPQSGGAFFDGYGARTGSQWKAFCTMLARNADRLRDASTDPCADLSALEGRHAAIVAGANRTFETLSLWLFPTSLQRTAMHDLQFA